MKNLIIVIFFLNLINSVKAQFNPDNFVYDISRESNELVINATHIGVGSAPMAGDELVDLNLAIKLPNSFQDADFVVSNLSSTFGITRNGSILKNGPGFKYIDFSMPNPVFLSSNWGGPVEILRFQFSSPIANQSDQATLASYNEIPSTSLPNVNVNYTDFTPNVIGFAPLPIKVKSFSAIKEGERASRLDWVTSSEVNSDYFGVERSADGNTWEQIGQVAAAGNSNTDLAYQYIDRKLPSFRAGENIFYYRLRLTDLDGQYKYTDVRGVNFGKTSNSIVSIYPNPTTEIINVDISGMSLDAGDVTLSVFDMNGRNMISKNILGNGIELIDVDQYPAGTYNVVVQQGETIQQKKIIKID